MVKEYATTTGLNCSSSYFNMQTYAAAGIVWLVSLSSVNHNCEPCKNCWGDWFDSLGVKSGGPNKPYIELGSIPPWERAVLGHRCAGLLKSTGLHGWTVQKHSNWSRWCSVWRPTGPREPHSSGITKGGQMRAVTSGTADEGVQNCLTKNISWLTITKLSLVEFILVAIGS